MARARARAAPASAGAVQLLLLCSATGLIGGVGALWCDWGPVPGSPTNTNPVDVSAGAVGRHVRSYTVDVPPHAHGGAHGAQETARAELYSAGTGDDEFDILHIYGSTAYGRGYVHGKALASKVTALTTGSYSHFKALAESGKMDTTNSTAALLKRLGFEGALQYVSNVTAPFTRPEMLAELAGLARGANVSYDVALGVHLFPELMQSSCTTVSGFRSATPDGQLLAVRALDWDTSGVLQNYPVLFVYHPVAAAEGADGGSAQAFASLGFAGFLGLLTGANEAGLTFASIGVGYPDDTFGPDIRAGEPWMYASRDVVELETTIEGATRRLRDGKRTSPLLLNVGSGPDHNASGIKYSSTVLEAYTAATLQPNTTWHPRVPDTVWWSMDWLCPQFDTVMGAYLKKHHGSLTAGGFIHDALPVVNTGNLHVAIFEFSGTASVNVYVANARGATESGPANAFSRTYVQLSLDLLFSVGPAA